MPNIVAVDPGKNTGVAYWQPGVRANDDPYLFKSDVWTEEQFYANIENLIEWADEVVVERFTVTQGTLTKSRGENWSLEFIGVMRYLCHKHGRPFELQLPTEAMSFATNDKLKKAGWHKKGVDHPNDAARHLMVYLLKKKYMTPQELQLV